MWQSIIPYFPQWNWPMWQSIIPFIPLNDHCDRLISPIYPQWPLWPSTNPFLPPNVRFECQISSISLQWLVWPSNNPYHLQWPVWPLLQAETAEIKDLISDQQEHRLETSDQWRTTFETFHISVLCTMYMCYLLSCSKTSYTYFFAGRLLTKSPPLIPLQTCSQKSIFFLRLPRSYPSNFLSSFVCLVFY